LLVAFNLGYAAYVSAEAVISADVNIVSTQAEITQDGHFICTAVVNNQNDDDAFGTKVVMLLPLQVKITGTSAKCSRSALQDGFNGYAHL
jgi:hypothetical protein